MDELHKLADAGYEVRVVRDESGYVADVSHLGYSMTAIADTLAGAVWAASPLHGEDERYEDTTEALTATAIGAVYADGFRAGRDAAAIREGADCKCGHQFADHTTPAPDVENLRGRKMCDREDCYCLAYHTA